MLIRALGGNIERAGYRPVPLAGVGALTSAIPVLHTYTLWLCLGILIIITVMNLRGTRESGPAWAMPTHLFVASMRLILVWSTYKLMASRGQPEPAVCPTAHPAGQRSCWRHLRARSHREELQPSSRVVIGEELESVTYRLRKQ